MHPVMAVRVIEQELMVCLELTRKQYYLRPHSLRENEIRYILRQVNRAND